MITCIVNPSRCGSTLLLALLDKYFRISRTPNYTAEYEIIDEKVGKEKMENPPSENYLVKYQYLFTCKPLLGADKYIVLDRKDKDAWAYSSFMSFFHHHSHGPLPDKEYACDSDLLEKHKERMFKLLTAWEKEKKRLIDQGAHSLCYEDIRDNDTPRILEMCGFPNALDFDKDDLNLKPILGADIPLVKMWSKPKRLVL
tara:strand:- start:2058 stop:2654 length:597 start_codon:yes stop_codon:yes gene_type:complete